jgi:cilia- and flagella-associated protein 57
VTSSKEDSTVRLWNYMSGQCEIAREYYVMEDNTLRAQAHPLCGAAIHPNGYQLAVSFIDKIAIYHILHDELRQYKCLEIKNASLIKFSHGGQYFFAVEKQWIYIYNAYTLQLIDKVKHQGVKATELVFNEHDRAFALVSTCGYVGKWKIPGF